MSCEQEIWRSKRNDVIWLEILAHIQGRSLDQQDQYFVNARMQVDCVLNEILGFVVNIHASDIAQPVCAACQMGNTCSNDTTCQTFHSVLHHAQSISELVQQQKDSLEQVEALLYKLEQVEQLYPTIRALMESHPIYETEKFQRRLKTLYLWRNVTRIIAYKLQIIAKVLYIDEFKDLGWPWIDYTWAADEDLSYLQGLY